MAAGPLLVSEPLQRYRALGLAGDPVWRAAGQLRTAIAARLSRQHADLLAIPEVDPTGRRIDWYAPFEGEVRKLRRSRAKPSARRSWTRCTACMARSRASPNSMEAPQRSSAERNFARLLRHALTAPGEDDALRRRRQAGHDLLGLLAPTPPCPASSWPARPPRRGPPSLHGRFPRPCSPRRPPSPRPARASAWWQWLLLACCCCSCWRCSPGWCGPTCRISSPTSKPRRAIAR